MHPTHRFPSPAAAVPSPAFPRRRYHSHPSPQRRVQNPAAHTGPAAREEAPATPPQTRIFGYTPRLFALIILAVAAVILVPALLNNQHPTVVPSSYLPVPARVAEDWMHALIGR